MANFCPHCGKPLADGESCNCAGQAPTFNAETAKSFFEAAKNHMGIGDPELNRGDAFEKGKQIVPDCVTANEGEIPVKQYTVATLRNRILGIPYTKAVGRIQVTNKRVIFRAPGRCLAGRTTLQHEFAIDELAGVEARREYTFNFWDLLIGLIATALGGFLITTLILRMCSSALYDGKTFGAIFLTMLFGVAGCLPFVMLKGKWLRKLLCLGGSFMPLLQVGSKIHEAAGYYGQTLAAFIGRLFTLASFLVLLAILFSLFVNAIRPNLVLLIKTKAASEAIDIKRRKLTLFGAKDGEHTGYNEVIPAEDAERCIRELDAVISDIQKLGDFGIEKWKV